MDQYISYLIPEMQKIYVKNNPDYIPSTIRDYRALMDIAKFICEQLGRPGQPHQYKAEILNNWTILAKAAAQDKFYRRKSLNTISNHIQEIAQIAKHGSADRTSKISGDDLRDGFDEYFGKPR